VSTAGPEGAHRRRNALTGRWVLVSPQRALRPWQGHTAAVPELPAPAHDPACYLCPGNARVGGEVNPHYRGVHVFDNDFPALPPAPLGELLDDPLLRAQPVHGRCRVICYSPHHSRTLPELLHAERRAVIDCWCEQSAMLGQDHAWVQVFENKGEQMGCSNPHPHGQVWASAHLPVEAVLEDRHQREYLDMHGRTLLLDVAAREAGGPREVLSNAHWLVLVPWWAAWPFETLLLPRLPIARLEDMDDAVREDLARALGGLASRYDALFSCPFPYSMGWHGAPHLPGTHPHWQLHAHFYPPLLRSANVRKFMVGYEMLAESQRDLTPEQAAARLREALPA
jgi:UDPglucose--hexose-1-phosphate uridylyltransferase